MVVGLAPTSLKFVIVPVTALATGTAGVNEVSDTITISSTSAVFVAGKVPTCTVSGGYTGTATALAQSANALRLTVTADIAASTATTIKCDGTTSYAGLDVTDAGVTEAKAGGGGTAATFTITNSLAGHYLFSVTAGGSGYKAGDTITVLGSWLGGADGANNAVLTVIGAAGIGVTAAEGLTTANVMIMGTPVASAVAGAFAVNPSALLIPFKIVTTKDTLNTGNAVASATYTTRTATESSFASVTTSNELVVGLVPRFLTFVFTPVTALVGSVGVAGGTNEFADTITISSTSAVFVAGKVPTCTVSGGYTGTATALAQSANALRLTVTADIAASTATTIKCDGTTSYAGLDVTDAGVTEAKAGGGGTAATFTITNSLAGHYLFSVTAGGSGYKAGDTITVLGSWLGGADGANNAVLTVIGAAGIGVTAAEGLTTANVMIMGTPVASAVAGAFAVNPSALLIPFKIVTTKDTLNTGNAVASATYTTRTATESSFASVTTSNELVVGLVPRFLTFVFTPVTALVGSVGVAGGTNEFADTITISSTSAVFVAGKVPTCTVSGGYTGTATALAQSANALRLTVTADIAASTATTIKCDGTTSYAGLDVTDAGVTEAKAGGGGTAATFTITNSLAGHYLFSVTAGGSGYKAGDTITVLGSWLGGADGANNAVLTVIGAAGIGVTAAEGLTTANVMIMGTPVASAVAGAFAVNPSALLIPFKIVTTKDTLNTGNAVASATYTTRTATESSFASVTTSNELVVGLVPRFLTFVFTPVTALVGSVGVAGGTNEFADTITISSTSAVFVAGKVPTCTVSGGYTGTATALAQSANALRLTVTADIAASTATTIKCDGTTSYAGLDVTDAGVTEAKAGGGGTAATFTITNSLAGHYLFSVTAGGSGYKAGDTITVLGSWLGGADGANNAVLTVIGAAGIGVTAAEGLTTANVMIMGTPVASAVAGAFAVNPSALLIPFKIVTTKDTLNTGNAVASATYTTRTATESSFASVTTSNELVVGLVPRFLTFVFTPVTALVGSVGVAGGTNEFADTITISSTSAVFVAGKVPTCTVSGGYTGTATALAQSANALRLTVTADIAASTATTIKCDGTTSYAGLDVTDAGVTEAKAGGGGTAATFTITNSLAGHYLFSVTAGGSGYKAGDTITVLGSWLGGADGANNAVLTVIGAAGIGVTAAEGLTTANVMIMGTPVASAVAGAFAVNPSALLIPFKIVTTKDTLNTGNAVASATYTTRTATESSFASVTTSNELVVGLVPRFLTFVFTPVTALVGSVGVAGGTNEFADTITISSTSAVFVAGKVPTCTVSGGYTGTATALAQSANALRLTVTADIAASTATTIKCDGTTSYAGLDVTDAGVTEAKAGGGGTAATFTITNSLAGHYLFSVTAGGSGYKAGDTITVLGSWLGGADGANNAVLTVIGAAGIGVTAAEGLTTANVMIMGTPVASAVAGAFAVNPSALLIPFKIVTTKDTLNTGNAVASATYTTRTATESSFASVTTSNELVVGLVPRFLTFVFTPVTALVGSVGVAGGTNEFADTITISSTSAVFVAGKVPTCTVSGGYTGTATALAQSANALRLTVTADIAASTATTIKCDGTTSYAGLDVTDAGVTEAKAGGGGTAATFTITNSLAGHYLFSVTAGGSGYKAGDTITVLGSWLGGADGANNAVLTVIGAAGIGVTAAEGLTTANVMIMGTPVASAVAGAFAVNPSALLIPFKIVTTKDTLNTGNAVASATYTTRTATESSFASVTTSNELVVGLVPRFLTFVFTPVTALVGSVGVAGGTNEFADTITISSTSAVFVAGKVPTCTVSGGYTGTATALAQSANALRLTVTADIAASTATTIKCDGTTSYAGLDVTDAGVTEVKAGGGGTAATFTITNSLAGHYLFSVTAGGSGYKAGDTITVLGSWLGGADGANNAVLTVIGAAGIGVTAAEGLTTANVMIMGTPVASAVAGAFAVNPSASTHSVQNSHDEGHAQHGKCSCERYLHDSHGNRVFVRIRDHLERTRRRPCPKIPHIRLHPRDCVGWVSGCRRWDQRIRRHDHDQFDKRGFRRRQGANLHSLWWVYRNRDRLSAISERPQAHGDGGHCRQYGDNDQVRRDDVLRGP